MNFARKWAKTPAKRFEIRAAFWAALFILCLTVKKRRYYADSPYDNIITKYAGRDDATNGAYYKLNNSAEGRGIEELIKEIENKVGDRRKEADFENKYN